MKILSFRDANGESFGVFDVDLANSTSNSFLLLLKC